MCINYYDISETHLLKNFCKLAEKCYYGKLRTNVLAQTSQEMQDLDKILWTYSKKHFIAHGTSEGAMREQQPIYITSSELEYFFNHPAVLIGVNFDQQSIINLLSIAGKHSHLERILFIGKSGIMNSEDFYSLIVKSQYGAGSKETNSEHNFFIMDDEQKGWSLVSA